MAKSNLLEFQHDSHRKKGIPNNFTLLNKLGTPLTLFLYHLIIHLQHNLLKSYSGTLVSRVHKTKKR